MATHSRYFRNEALPLLFVKSPLREVEEGVTELVTECPPKAKYSVHECNGLFQGPTGIAYLFLHLSHYNPGLLLQGQTPEEWCLSYLAGARPKQSLRVDGNHCGVGCEALAYAAVSAAATKDGTHIKEFLAHLPTVLLWGADASSEWLYGRAGTLYLLRLMRLSVLEHKQELEAAIREVIKAIMAAGGGCGDWEWHGKKYFGAVHGTVGIVTQVALSLPFSSAPQTDPLRHDQTFDAEAVLNALQPILASVLELQDKNGNWPSRAGSERDELVQFCHGAPGVVISLQALHDRKLFLGLKQRMESAVKRGRDVIWERGMLTKEPCLCHGITGNAMAFGGVSGEGETEAARREHFLAYTTREMIRKGQREGWYAQSSDPWGLYYGLAGRICGFLELAREKEGIGKGNAVIVGYCDV
jgi:hypothetical protein